MLVIVLKLWDHLEKYFQRQNEKRSILIIRKYYFGYYYGISFPGINYLGIYCLDICWCGISLVLYFL